MGRNLVVGTLNVRLPDRLERIAAHIPPGVSVADVGTDHAYLPVFLVGTGRCPRAVAVEVRPGPFRRAQASVKAAGLADRIDVRLGDGLAPLRPGEAGVIVMAGMGGPAIRGILERGLGVARSAGRLVLQPQGGAAGLRRWLLSHGFALVDEDLVAEGGRLYEIVVAEPQAAGPTGEAPAPARAGPANGAGDAMAPVVPPPEREPRRAAGPDAPPELPPDLLLEVGPVLYRRRHPLLADKVRALKEKDERIARHIGDASAPAARQRLEAVARRVRAWEDVLQWLQASDRS